MARRSTHPKRFKAYRHINHAFLASKKSQRTWTSLSSKCWIIWGKWMACSVEDLLVPWPWALLFSRWFFSFDFHMQACTRRLLILLKRTCHHLPLHLRLVCYSKYYYCVYIHRMKYLHAVIVVTLSPNFHFHPGFHLHLFRSRFVWVFPYQVLLSCLHRLCYHSGSSPRWKIIFRKAW